MNCKELQKLFDKKKKSLPYAKESKSGGYGGWTTDFNIRVKTKPSEIIGLDLHKESDLFLLFVLASAWSRSGHWEDPAFFVSYLKGIKNINSMAKVKAYVDSLPTNATQAKTLSNSIYNEYKKFDYNPSAWREPKRIRIDLFQSVKILYSKWNSIKAHLKVSSESGDYKTFMVYLRSIKGLGSYNKKMVIKIPLILRELRIQNVYNNIPGEYCCVPDMRVKEIAMQIDELKALNFSFYSQKDEDVVDKLIETSSTIYKYFGDWYDIVLFAYPDLI